MELFLSSTRIYRIARCRCLVDKAQGIVGHRRSLRLERRENTVGVKCADKGNIALTKAIVIDGRYFEIHLLVVGNITADRLVEINRHPFRHD